jgi:hypothetical protein
MKSIKMSSVARARPGGTSDSRIEDTMKKTVLLLATMCFAVPALAAEQAKYPQGFHDWQHVKSMVINKGHPLFDLVGGMHHIYASPKAMKGYKAGKFPDGAVIVFDLFETKEADNAILEGTHKAVIVMEKGSKRFAQTGGWGFEVFDPKTKKGSLDAKAVQECFVCHTQQKDKDFVFSQLRE